MRKIFTFIWLFALAASGQKILNYGGNQSNQTTFNGTFTGNGSGLTNLTTDAAARSIHFAFGLFAGDSIAFGTFVNGSNFSFFLTNYPNVSIPISINTSIPGQTVSNMNYNFTTQIGQYFTGTNLELAAIEGGVNDINSGIPWVQVATNLTNIWFKIHALNPNAKVLAFTVPVSLSAISNSVQANREALNSWIRNSSALWDYLFDWPNAIPSPKQAPVLYVDGVLHPTAFANSNYIAPGVLAVLERAPHALTTKALDPHLDEAPSYGVLSNSSVFLGGAGSSTSITNPGAHNFFGDYNSGTSVTTGSYNSGLGELNLEFCSTGWQNDSSGYAALLNLTSGSNNTAHGYGALNSLTTGFGNTATGASSMQNGNPTNSTATGKQALQNSSGTSETATGYESQNADLTGQNNTSDGAGSLGANQYGIKNTAMGASSLPNATNSSNTALGYKSGSGIVKGTGNIDIADNPSGVGSIDETNVTRIGQFQKMTIIAGIILSTNGFSSFATNTFSGFTTTGYTNTSTNTMRLQGLTGVAVQWTNITVKVGANYGTITSPIMLTLNPNEAVYGTSMSVLTNISL